MPRKVENKAYCCNQWVTVLGKFFEVATPYSFHSDTAWVRGTNHGCESAPEDKTAKLTSWAGAWATLVGRWWLVTFVLQHPQERAPEPKQLLLRGIKRETVPEQKRYPLEEILSKLGRLFSHCNPGLLLILLYFTSLTLFIHSTNLYWVSTELGTKEVVRKTGRVPLS